MDEVKVEVKMEHLQNEDPCCDPLELGNWQFKLETASSDSALGLNIKTEKLPSDLQQAPANKEVTPLVPESFSCASCSKEFVSKQELEKHFKRSCFKGVFELSKVVANREAKPNRGKMKNRTCKICGKDFSSSSALAFNRHMATHSETSKFKCKVCAKGFCFVSELRKHMVFHTGVRNFKCSQCNKKFLSISNLNRHQLIHSREEDPFLKPKKRKCEICSKSYSQGYFALHMKTHARAKDHKCSQCDKEFVVASELYQHKCVHSKKFECAHCNKKFGILKGLQKHLHIHSGIKFKCNFGNTPYNQSNVTHSTETKETGHNLSPCGKEFLKSSHLRQHMLEHPVIRNVECTQCNKKFVFLESLKRHMLVHSGKINYFKCGICNKSFLRKYHLDKHVNKCNSEVKEANTCKVCNKEFSSVEKVNQHMTRHSAVKKFECAHCGKKFAFVGYLKTHIKYSHLDEKNFECNICNKLFSRKYSRDDHVREHHSVANEVHQCKLCAKTFNRARKVNKHMAVHAEVKAFACAQCGKRFNYLRYLQRHIKVTHLDEKNFECNICKKLFHWGYIRDAHVREHHNMANNVHKCKLCAKAFSSASKVKLHMAVHAVVKKFECAQCDTRFTNIRRLKRHIKVTHLNEKNFQCNICSRSFYDKWCRDKHVKNQH